MTQSRKYRGNRTNLVVARWFKDRGWPHAEPVGAGRAGVDVLGMAGLAVEVKARTGFSPLAWLRQARAEARHGLPLVVFRCNGQGEANVGEWGALLTLEDLTQLLRDAGFGSDESVEDA